MTTFILGLGGVGGKVVANISRGVRSAYCFVCVDCNKAMANSEYNTVQKLRGTVVLKVAEKLRRDYSDLIQWRISRIWKKQVRNECRSMFNGIYASLHQTNQKQDTHKKTWQGRIGMSCRDIQSSGNSSDAADWYAKNIGLILRILNQQKTKQSDCRIGQYRRKNGLTETENHSDSEQHLWQLQNQGIFYRKFTCWSSIMLSNDGKQGKTDTVKVCERNRSRSRISPNHMSRLFVFLPEFRTIGETRQMSVVFVA